MQHRPAHPAPRPRPRRGLAVLLAFAAIAALTYVALTALGETDTQRGPLATRDFLDPTDTAGADSGDIVVARRTVTWRSVILTNPTNKPAAIKQVTLLDAGGLRIIDARAAGRGRSNATSVGHSWPPTGPSIYALRGAVVPPRSRTGLQLYLRVQAPADFLTAAARKNGTAVASTRGVRVRYVHDGHDYDTTITSNALVFCNEGPDCSGQLPSSR